MASTVPAGLRTADIGRFALRAAQIEKAKPVIAYWCECAHFPAMGHELITQCDRQFPYREPNYRERPSHLGRRDQALHD